MCQRGALEVGVDLFDDRVPAVASAATVSSASLGAVVKNAWKRHTSNRVPWPAAFFCSACTSGMRRTTSRPGTRSAFFLLANAVNGISATSAREIHVPVASSRIASGYLIVVHACSPMPAIVALTGLVARTVTDTCAPPVIAAWIASRP